MNGSAVFMSSNPNGVPIVLLHHWKHNQVLHKTVILLSVISENLPEIPVARRVQSTTSGKVFFRSPPTTGSCRRPTCPRSSSRPRPTRDVPYEPGSTSYYLGRETLLATKKSGMHPVAKVALLVHLA